MMTHDDLSGHMDAREERIMAAIAEQAIKISILEHQQKQITDAHNTRLHKLETERVDINKQLQRIETKIDEIHPSILELQDLMRAWGRRQ